jgi:hypothetical protein
LREETRAISDMANTPLSRIKPNMSRISNPQRAFDHAPTFLEGSRDPATDPGRDCATARACCLRSSQNTWTLSATNRNVSCEARPPCENAAPEPGNRRPAAPAGVSDLAGEGSSDIATSQAAGRQRWRSWCSVFPRPVPRTTASRSG